MWSVLLVFLSSFDRNLVKGDSVSNSLHEEKQSKETFCAKVSSVERNFLYEVSDGTDVVHSMVSAAGKLVNCSINVNTEQVTSFTHECKLQRSDDRVERQVYAPYARVDEARLLCQRFTEKLQQSEKPMQQEDQVLKRAKRGFTYPGTLWCGAGNMADNYNQLGDFAETDSCCRTHDHCPHVIHAFSSNYGHTNFKWHSISHCDCDNTFKDCLRKVNDTSSRVVGQAFFNVIGVPCFKFAYEEQCVERHWYGLCKRYEKRPIAVLIEAVPYDFGGIDVIDELTVAPSKKKASNTSKEQVKSDTTTQSTMSGSQGSSPEEPSLQNVVTAAEDFIKVLATVSTSQSSTNDSEKSDAQSSDKKKKKTKKKKTKKTKGKGRRRKQKAEVVVKIEDSAADPLSNIKTESTIRMSNYLSESQSPEQSGRQSKRVKELEYELGDKEQTSNEVMKDDPAMEEDAISMTSPSPVPKKPAKKAFLTTLSTTTSLYRAKTKWLRNRKRKVKPVPPPSSNISTPEPETTTTAITATNIKPQPSIVGTTEWPLIVNTTPIQVTKVKKNRSKLMNDREKRKKRQKSVSAASSAAAVVNENAGDNLKEADTLTTGTPTVASQRANISGVRDSAHVMALNTSFSVLKRQRQRSKEKGLTKRRRKGPSLVHLDEQLSQNNVDDTLPILLPTPTAAFASPAITAAKSGSTEDTQTTTKWQLFTTTSKPTVGTKRLMNKKRGKSRKKAVSVAVHDPVTFASPPTKLINLYLMRSDTHATTTSANPALSHMQITIEKVKEQLDKKKRRKAALSSFRQQ